MALEFHRGAFRSRPNHAFIPARLFPDAALDSPRTSAWPHWRSPAALHAISKSPRATSRDLDLEPLAAGACRRGIGGVGPGDFPPPAWCAELKQKLVPA